MSASRRSPAWTEVRVLVPSGWHELAAEALAFGPCTSVAFGRPSLGSDEVPPGLECVRTFILAERDTEELRSALARALAALASRAGAEELAGLAPTFHRLPPEDYSRSWRKSWKPFRLGRLCVVPPDWRGSLRPGDTRLELEPGGAFGTGRHATTRACLAAIQRRVKPGQRILDAGCGSGILAVAALKLGAESALGFDLDPDAIPFARDLAERNGVARRCEWRAGGFEVLSDRDRGFDGAVANLYADLLRSHAGELASRLAPGGWFGFSGCPSERRSEVLAVLAAAGLRVEELRTRGRWDAFVGRTVSSGE